MSIWTRIKDFGPWSRAQKERDLEREIQNHLDLEAEESGQYGALRAFGNAVLVKEDVRAAWGWTRLEQLAHDVRYGLRQVRRNPAFSGIAIATLALGIGGITAMFSAFDTILIRPLPYAGADRLVMVWDDLSNEGISKSFPAPAEWLEWQRHNTVFTDIAATQPGDATLSGDSEPEQVPARKTTANLWSVLGVNPLIGRVFTEEEDVKGVRVLVTSHGLWQRRYGGSPDVVGRKITVNDNPYEVIGVMPRDFYFMPARDIDIWMPASFALLALLLASLGLYGVLSYAVTQRTNEIGVRMALGATSNDILRSFGRRGLALTLAGLSIGLVLSIMAARLMTTLFYGFRPDYIPAVAVVSLILLAVAALACFVPARRASCSDPMIALRHE